jgi:hypothetical protein
MSEMTKVLRKGEFEEYLALENYWKKDFSSFFEQVKIASVRQTKVKGAILKLVNELPPWEKKFGELLNKHGLIMQEEKPIFLLKSGYRSMYFFNPSHLISRSNVKKQENQEIMGEFKEILKMFIQHLKTELGTENIAVLLVQKIGGEDPGTSQFAPLFTELGVPSVYLDPNLDMLKGPIIEGDTLLIPFDGVTTTGKTVELIIDRYERIIKAKPRVYILLWNRSPYPERKPRNVPIWSIGSHLVLPPEILNLSLATFDDNLGYLWPSLFLFYDYLRDIYLYAEQDLTRYQKIRGEFEKLIIESYNMEAEKTMKLFDHFDTKLPPSDILTYFINVHILCWNTIFEISLGDKVSRLEDPVRYIETMLRIEKAERPSTIICPLELKKGLECDISIFPKLIDPWDKIHRIFVLKTTNIVEYFKNKYKGCEILDMREKRTITLEEAYRIIDETLKKRREIYKRFNIELTTDESKLRELMLRHLKQFYNVVE